MALLEPDQTSWEARAAFAEGAGGAEWFVPLGRVFLRPRVVAGGWGKLPEEWLPRRVAAVRSMLAVR